MMKRKCRSESELQFGQQLINVFWKREVETMNKRKTKKIVSGLLALAALMGSILSPVAAMAEELPQEEQKPPLYEEVKDLLDENEIVIAKNLGIDLGSSFDLENDLSNIEIPDEETVKVTFEEAKNTEGEEFSTEKLDVFEAVYYVEPLKTDHPKYQISRKLIVKEPGTEILLEDETEEMQEDLFLEEASMEESETVMDEFLPETEPEVMTEAVEMEIVEDKLSGTEFMEAVIQEETIMELDSVVSDETESAAPDIEVIEIPVTEKIPETEQIEQTETITEVPVTETPVEEPIAVEEIEETQENVNEEETSVDVEVSEDIEIPEEDTANERCDNNFRARLKIVKQDHDTGRTILIPNTEFKVYDLERQKYVEQVTTYPSTYVHKSYFTDSQGYLIMPESLEAGTYRIEEVQAPTGYMKNDDVVEVTVDQEAACQTDQDTGELMIEVVIEGRAVKGELNIRTQGEAVYGYQDGIFLYESRNLQGAEYEVYAAEDIYSSDFQKNENGERNLIFAEGALVMTVITDEAGTAVAEDLLLGLYEIREKKAPSGYVRNDISKTVSFEYEDQDTAVVKQNLLFTSERQKVEICAVQQDAENGSAVDGAILALYNKEDLVNSDGEIILAADTLIQKTETSEDGRAVFSTHIPLGRYYVKEWKTPSGYVSSDEVLEFEAGYQGQDIPVVQLQGVKKNAVTTVEIVTADKNTGIHLGGASLSLLDKGGNLITSWTSQKEHPQVVKRLKAGETYILREDFAPYGYLREQDLTFTVEDTAETQMITMYNDVPTALLIINSEGQFLDSVPQEGTDSGSGKNMTFYVYAAEDIEAADGISESHFKKDELIGKITTDSYGIAQMGNLPVGRYYVKEEGSDKAKHADLSYRDQDTAVVTYSEDWQEERQKVVICVMNRDKETKTALSGAVFGLFTSEEIKSSTGMVLMEKDQMIEKQSSDENGKLTFTAELPENNAYYVQELTASSGYVTDETKQEFILECKEDQRVNTYELVFEDVCTTVELTLLDMNSKEKVSGAQVKVCNESGDIMDTWISRADAYVIHGLEVGKTYVMTNTVPALGYVTAEKVQFMVENTADVQKVEMMTDVTKLLISKKDVISKAEVPGAKIIILDEDDQVVESWITDGEAHYVEKLPIGSYSIREEQAAKGYVIRSDVRFELADSGKVQSVSMVNDTAKGKVIINLTDAETGSPLMGAEFELRDAAGNVLETLRTDAAGHAESSLYEIASYKKGVMDDALTYHLVQTKNLQGYVLDGTEHKIVFEYESDDKPIIEVTMELKNGTDTEKPHMPGTATTLAENPKTGDGTNIILPVVLMFSALCLIVWIVAEIRASME